MTKRQSFMLLVVAALAILAPAAFAASYLGSYKGRTSQKFALTAKVNEETFGGGRKPALTMNTKLRYECAKRTTTQRFQFSGMPLTLKRRRFSITLVAGASEAHVTGSINGKRLSGSIRAQTPGCQSGLVRFTAKRR